MRARAIGNVVIDAHGKGIRLLKHHAHTLAQKIHVHLRRIDFLPVQRNGASDLAAGHEIIHAVQRLQQRAFAAAAGADEGGDRTFRQVQLHVL